MQKRYDPHTIEPDMQRLWRQNNTYAFGEEDGRPVYSIDTPPATISGSLHIGHVFSYTQAEIVARFHRMQNERVFYPFGFDNNGLPTERLVEREQGIQARDLPREEFAQKCRETSERYTSAFRELWQSFGFSVDWSLQYETCGEEAMRISQQSFLELAQAGKAYLKESPVHWCTECQTSIAQAELETAERESAYYHIPFAAGGQQLIVATTRPELLYGCACLFVNPDDARYSQYVGKTACVPLYGFTVPILADEKAAPDKGTGVVMCCTFGDSTDAKWAEEYKLPYKKVILPDGHISQDTPLLSGLTVKKARTEIVRLLDEHGLLCKTEPITHAVSIHERCGHEVEILPSRQWYIDVLSEKERYRRAADEIRWYPAHMKARYLAWVENLKWDWCISRQRYYGVPFPVWYCKTCGKPFFARAEDLPVHPESASPSAACTCGCTSFIPETAVLDTWATSSLTPQINARWKQPDERKDFLPMSMHTQAHEIIRTWAFYTIVKSLFHTGQIPWKDAMICGFVLAKKGEKISKSKGNSALSPSALLERHSADAIRYWAADTRLGTDATFSEDELKISERFLTKLYNAARFSFSHLADFSPDGVPPSLPADCWITERLSEATKKAAEYLSAYELGLARHEIDAFFWSDFCDCYLELIKERLYRPDLHGEEERRSGQRALYACLLGILKLYAPFVPHITEYLYQQYYRQFEPSHSLHTLTWEKGREPDPLLSALGETLQTVIRDARRYKTERGLSMKAKMDGLKITAQSELLPLLRRTAPDLLACCGAASIVYEEK